MIYLRCTKKLLDDLAPDVDPFPASGRETLLGDWYANVIRIRSCKGLLFTNERTLFSFVVFDVPKARRRDRGASTTPNLPAIIKKVNRTPQMNLGGKYSIEALTELLMVKWMKREKRR